jgi:hypothetical protein
VRIDLNLQDLLCLTIFIYIIYLQIDSGAIQTAYTEIYIFTMGTPYKIYSRILVLASTGQGFFHFNLPARRHPDTLRLFCMSFRDFENLAYLNFILNTINSR